MSPEQLEAGEPDPRTDIFAFGAVLYELVTGRKAFEGKSQASLISSIYDVAAAAADRACAHDSAGAGTRGENLPCEGSGAPRNSPQDSPPLRVCWSPRGTFVLSRSSAGWGRPGSRSRHWRSLLQVWHSASGNSAKRTAFSVSAGTAGSCRPVRIRPRPPRSASHHRRGSPGLWVRELPGVEVLEGTDGARGAFWVLR